MELASPAPAASGKDWRQPPVEGVSPLLQPTVGQAIKAAAANRRAKRPAEEEHHLSTSQKMPAQLYPEPAPWAYYRVTAAQLSEDQQTLRMDLISDSGEPWQGVEAPVAEIGPQAADVQPGDRFTWDGNSLENRVPVASQVEIQELVANLNALPAQKRVISRRDAQMVQFFRQSGYVFNADNRVVAVEEK